MKNNITVRLRWLSGEELSYVALIKVCALGNKQNENKKPAE